MLLNDSLSTVSDSVDTVESRLSTMSLLQSNVYQDYDTKLPEGTFRILYGITNISNVQYIYISFDIHWVRLQFRSNSTTGLQFRIIYGNSIGSWYTFTKT